MQFPGISKAQPFIGDFDLPAILNFLIEHAIFIANAITYGRYLQSGKRIHVTGCETPQAAIAQSWFFFLLKQVFQLDIIRVPGFPHFLKQTKVDQVIV